MNISIHVRPWQWCFATLIIGLSIGYFSHDLAKQNFMGTFPTAVASRNVSNSEFSALDLIEEVYESTLKSCLGSRCFDQLVSVRPGQTIARVGFLVIPNSGGEIVYEFLKEFFPTDLAKAPVDVILDTHVPAYGYGKNHGWSSIVRVSRRVLHHSYSLLRKSGLDYSGAVMKHQVNRLPYILYVYYSESTITHRMQHCRSTFGCRYGNWSRGIAASTTSQRTHVCSQVPHSPICLSLLVMLLI